MELQIVDNFVLTGRSRGTGERAGSATSKFRAALFGVADYDAGNHQIFMKVPDYLEKKRPGRHLEGLAACLLPFDDNGEIAGKAFREAIERTAEAGLGCAVNMDTG